MNKNILDSNFAFEVDLEKMEGRYLFSTGESLQREAEKVLLEKCDYIRVVVSVDNEVGERVVYKGERIWGLSLSDWILPAGDSITTQLATEKGFICQVWASFWQENLEAGEQVFIISDEGVKFPINIINTPEDVL